MKIVSVRHIDGPNVYLYKPILVARVHLEELTERESFHYAGFADALLTCLPGLRDHHCAKGAPGGFVERLYGGTYFGHIAEHVAIELATILGLDVHYGKTVYADGPGHYDIVMECKFFECQRRLLERAIGLVHQLLEGQRPLLDLIFDEAKKILARTGLGPSTQAIYDAAIRRGIPVERIGNGSMLQLGYGVNKKRVAATITDNTSCVGVDIACNKDVTKQFLERGGIPVPQGGIAHSEDESVALWTDYSVPVVLKPLDGNQGKGVSLNLHTEAEIRKAFAIASAHSSAVVVETYIPGENVRLLVVDGACVAVSKRVAAHVVGDGRRTIAELIQKINENPIRGTGHEKPLTQIIVDEVVEETLKRNDFTLNSVPQMQEIVFVRESANLSTGGEAEDITDVLHPTYLRLAERAAIIIGLDVCGIDMVISSMSEPASRENCAVIEVNAAPGIRMHEHPSQGQARDVGDAIVASLYPVGENGRIPIVAVTGTNGKTTTTRLIAHGIARMGMRVGMTTTGGVYVGGELVVKGDTTGPASARMVLSDPTVEAAVLETARGGIVRGGLAYDRANVAVMTNISLDHVGQDGVDNIDDLVRIKSLVAECVHSTGVVVLCADDEQLMKLRPRLSTTVYLTSLSDCNPAIRRHLEMSGTAFYVSEGMLVEATGNFVRPLVSVAEIPLTMRGTASFQVENSLHATAGMRALGIPQNEVIEALCSFQPEENVGRCMIYRFPTGSHIVLDYGHNPAGFRRVGEWLNQVPHRTLFGVVGVPGDRSNEVVEESAGSLAQVFDAFIIKEDDDKRGRQVGEIATLIAKHVRQQAPKKPAVIIHDEREAVTTAIQQMHPGDVTVVFYESLQPLLDIVASQGGERVSEISTLDEILMAIQPQAWPSVALK